MSDGDLDLHRVGHAVERAAPADDLVAGGVVLPPAARRRRSAGRCSRAGAARACWPPRPGRSPSVPRSASGAVPRISGSDDRSVAGSQVVRSSESVRSHSAPSNVGQREGAQRPDVAGGDGGVARRAGGGCRGRRPGRPSTGVTEYRSTTCPDRVPRLSRRSRSSLSDMGPTGPVPKLGMRMVAQPGNAATAGPATRVATISADRAQDRDAGPPPPVAVRRRWRGAQGEQEQVEQAGPGDRPAARGEAEDDRGDPQRRRTRDRTARARRGRSRRRSASRKTATAPTTTRSSAGRTPTIGTSDALMTRDALACGGERPVQRAAVRQDLEPPGRCPVPDEDDADGDDRARRASAPTRTGSRRGRRSTTAATTSDDQPRRDEPAAAHDQAGEREAGWRRSRRRTGPSRGPTAGPRGMRCRRPVTGPTPGVAASSRRSARRA